MCVGGGGGGVIAPQEQRFRLKKGCLFRPKSAKGGYFSNLGTSMVYALVGRGMPGMVSVRENSPRPYYWHRQLITCLVKCEINHLSFPKLQRLHHWSWDGVGGGWGVGGVIGPQEQRFRLKKGCLFRPKSAKGGYFSNLGTSMVYALVGRGMPGMVSVRDNSPRPYYWHRQLITCLVKCEINHLSFPKLQRLHPWSWDG